MKLEVRDATAADLERAKSIYGPEKGDLCSPLIERAWPETETNARERAEWSCQLQKELLEDDPNAVMIKVVDTDNDDDIIAFARYSKDGTAPESGDDAQHPKAKEIRKPPGSPEGMNTAFMVGVIERLNAERGDWKGDGPCWSKKAGLNFSFLELLS